MSVATVTSSAHVHGQRTSQRRDPGSDHKPLDQARVGEEVSLRILSRIADGRFLAASGDSRYFVDSTLPFAIGQTVKATVSALGGIVELKYLGSGQFEQLEAEPTSASPERNAWNPPFLAKLESQYKRTLSESDRDVVASVALQVAQPEAVGASALYLDKVGAEIKDNSLHALYGQQVWNAPQKQAPAVVTDLSALIGSIQQGDDRSVAILAKTLGDAIDPSTSAQIQSQEVPEGNTLLLTNQGSQLPTPQSGDHDDLDDATLTELAHRLLNAQDSRAIAHHYGSLPVIIDNQLIELDLLMFRERESPTRSQGLRKLVMTLKTETLGRVEVVAQSLDNTLSIAIATQSPEATERLAAQAQEVRELVARLGWNVDSVAYRLTATPSRAADQLIRHVLTSGTLDAVV